MLSAHAYTWARVSDHDVVRLNEFHEILRKKAGIVNNELHYSQGTDASFFQEKLLCLKPTILELEFWKLLWGAVSSLRSIAGRESRNLPSR